MFTFFVYFFLYYLSIQKQPASGVYSAVRKRTLNSTKPKPYQCQICKSKFTR